MTIYISTSFAPLHSAVTDVLTSLAQCGITSVELGSTHCYEPDLVSRLKQFEIQYIVHNYFPPSAESFIVNIASTSTLIRTRSLRHAMDSISFCRQIGASLYTVHPGFMFDPSEESESTENYDFIFFKPRVDYTSEDYYNTCFDLFIDSARLLCRHAQREGVRLAVESQGSVLNANNLFLQHPDDFERLMTAFAPTELGINLNLGHLNLASQAFGFDREAFIRQISDYIAAFEISHNDGQKDDHGPLVKEGWYWKVIRDKRFTQVPKIFEGRNLSLQIIRAMVDWLIQETN